MTTLTPTGSGRRSPFPVVFAVIVALILGVGGGWWFAGRDKGTTGASPSNSTSCSPKPSGSVSGSPAANGKPVALPKPTSITLNVYNATTRKGLARTTAAELAARGFKTAAVANDPLKKAIPGSVEIRAGKAGAGAAKVAAAQVVGSVIVVDKRTSQVVDFVIGDGYAALATPEQVKIALLPSPSASPTC